MYNSGFIAYIDGFIAHTGEVYSSNETVGVYRGIDLMNIEKFENV